MAHREPFEVLFAHVDMMGHVNNAAYLTYFENARTRYVLQLKGVPYPPATADLDIIVARAAVDYLRGLRWGERGEVVVWPTRVGRTSFTLAYALVDASGRVAARGETVQVCFDYDRMAKKDVAPTLRAALERELAAGPGVAD
jgi:acyl-CoA thioester hydrolase